MLKCTNFTKSSYPTRKFTELGDIYITKGFEIVNGDFINGLVDINIVSKDGKFMRITLDKSIAIDLNKELVTIIKEL